MRMSLQERMHSATYLSEQAYSLSRGLMCMLQVQSGRSPALDFFLKMYISLAFCRQNSFYLYLYLVVKRKIYTKDTLQSTALWAVAVADLFCGYAIHGCHSWATESSN